MFWDVILTTLWVIPVTLLMALALYDLFMRRPDLHMGQKLGFGLLIVVLPLIGSAVYLLSRPEDVVDPAYARRAAAEPAALEPAQIRRVLESLHAEGILDDAAMDRARQHYAV